MRSTNYLNTRESIDIGRAIAQIRWFFWSGHFTLLRYHRS